MRSSDVTAGNTIYASDVNKLRDDAYASSWLLAHEQTSPDLTLKIEEGTIDVWGNKIEFPATNSPSFTAPATNPRIDLLSIVGSNEEQTISQTSQDTDGLNLGGAGAGTTDNRDGQVFNISSFASNCTSDKYSISKITVYGLRESGTASGVFVSLWNVSAGVPTTMISETTVNKSLFTTSNTAVTITGLTFNNLTIGTDYAIIFRNTNGSSNELFRLRYNSTSAYANGTRVTSTNAGSSWSTTTQDLYFVFDIVMEGVTYTVTRTAGTEAVSPVAPTLPDNAIAIAEVYNRTGQTSIKDTDDATNGYISKDLRVSFSMPNVKVIQYTDNSVFVKQTGVKKILVELFGAGGGGGGGSNDTGTSNNYGGTGGGGGAYNRQIFLPSELSSIETILIGIGGAGGTGGATGGINYGTEGGTGTYSSFGSLLYAYGGGGGIPGAGANARTGGSGGGWLSAGVLGTDPVSEGGSPRLVPTATTPDSFSGGGGSGSLSASNSGNAEYGGASGAKNGSSAVAGGSSIYGGAGGGNGGRNTDSTGGNGGKRGSFTAGGGMAGGAPGVNGTDATILGYGGGGGGGENNAGVAAGSGGDGAIAGGGGGGGSSSNDGGAGSGGNGGNGLVIITEFY